MICSSKNCNSKKVGYGAEFGGKTFNYCNKHLVAFALKDDVSIVDLNDHNKKLSLEEKSNLIIKILGDKK